MPSDPYDCTNTDPLFQLYEQVRDYLLDLLERLRNALNDLWDYFAQARPIDVVKKDDDLWSPRHSHSYNQPFFTGLGSESAFLSHFLPAPGNHPSSTSGHLSSNALRADLQRTRQTGLAAFLLHRPAPTFDEEQGISSAHPTPRDLPVLSTHQLNAEAPHSSFSERQEQHTHAAYPGRQPLALQLSPKLRSSLPILPEQPSAAAQGAPFAVPSAASLPLEAEPAAQPAHSLPSAPRTAVSRRETRQPHPEAPHLRLSASMPAQQTTLAVDSSAPGVTQQQQHHEQQQDVPLGVIEVPSAKAAGTHALFEGGSMHERSASGQEQGLAMAERVIDAYGLGMKPPAASGEDPAASGAEDSMAASMRQQSSVAASGQLGMAAAPQPRMIDPQELTLGALIGEGGFGKVYYGAWRGLEVAVKVMSADITQQVAAGLEFRRELAAMTLLSQHRNVLPLLGACMQSDLAALVTPYCPRGSLYGMLHSPTLELTWAQVAAMSCGAARGMQHLHAHSVLHRDLKSGNLLVDEDYNVRVADFGLSRVTHDLNTLTGGLGTFQYMAPEVMANQRYSVKADVYSFGMVLWECTARQVPYAGLSGIQAALAVMHRGLRPDIPSHTPAPLAQLIQECWQPLPSSRPSFSDIVPRLETMQSDFCG